MSEAEASNLRMRYINGVSELQQLETDIAAWNEKHPGERIEMDLADSWRIVDELGKQLIAAGVIHPVAASLTDGKGWAA